MSGTKSVVSMARADEPLFLHDRLVGGDAGNFKQHNLTDQSLNRCVTQEIAGMEVETEHGF
jgi:hypothetical protein